DADHAFLQYDLSEPDGKLLSSLEGRIQEPGDPPDPGDWPRYEWFTFDPFTGTLFAAFVSNYFGDFQTSLCTVALMTGQRHKIIATYDKLNWGFVITWGLSR